MDDTIFIERNPINCWGIMKYETIARLWQPEYYLGGDMEISKDGEMAWSAKTYIKNVTERIGKLLETKLRSWDKPMAENHYLELDDTSFFQISDIFQNAKY